MVGPPKRMSQGGIFIRGCGCSSDFLRGPPAARTTKDYFPGGESIVGAPKFIQEEWGPLQGDTKKGVNRGALIPADTL